MPYVLKPARDPEEQRLLLGSTGGGEAAPGTAPGPSAAPPPESGAFTDFRAYLAGDPGAGLVGKLTGGLDATAGNAAALKPEDSDASYEAVNSQRADARSMLDATGKPGGLDALLGKSATPGEGRFNAFLAQGAGAEGSLAALRQKYAGLLDPLNRPPPANTLPTTEQTQPGTDSTAPKNTEHEVKPAPDRANGPWLPNDTGGQPFTPGEGGFDGMANEVDPNIEYWNTPADKRKPKKADPGYTAPDFGTWG